MLPLTSAQHERRAGLTTMKPVRLIIIALFAVAGSALYAAPFGTAFTYQGRLADAGQANGGSVPGAFYVTAGTNQTLRYVSPFAQSFILNWIAVEL